MCRELYGEGKKKCSACVPELMSENEDAWDLWRACATQWRVGGMGGLIGLDYAAVFRVAEVMEIEMTAVLLLKIRALETQALDRQAESARPEILKG